MSLLATIGKDLSKSRAYVNHVGKKRYYSSADATILLGSTKVEEIVQINWHIEEAKNPLFGYNSYTFDEVATGARLVTGMLAINFIIPDFLNVILNSKAKEDTSISYNNSGTKLETDKHKSFFPGSFDISIAYGKEDPITGKTPYTFLEECHVKSSGMALDPSGKVLCELYEFIAKDVSYSR